MLVSAVSSHVGKVRHKNEDNYFLNGIIRDPESAVDSCDNTANACGVYAVCDGMGGGTFGEVASVLAVNALYDVFTRNEYLDLPVAELFSKYVVESNDRICAEMTSRGTRKMGTTFVAACVIENTVDICNIGDSRAYLLRDGKLKQISRDHTEIRTMVEMGFLTPAQAREHACRHTLTQHLGVFPSDMEIQPYVFPEFQMENGDFILLCSDGLTDMLEDFEIEEIMIANSDMNKMVDELVSAALKKGGKDNITVLVVNRQ
ncbi:MAG: protein phosphatase 2C domain-containing protein [Oscillospiraceae bacterium]|nr:protein phosphatase 2C domain-containing protein [Oscillospiraceae bacterium]